MSPGSQARSALAVVLLALSGLAAQQVRAGQGEGPSAAFPLYLGPHFTPPSAHVDAASTSEPFSLALGPDLLPPGTWGTSFADGASFALYLGPLKQGADLSAPFDLDTRVIPVLLVPDESPPLVWIAPERHQISWRYEGPVSPDHWELYYSANRTDAGDHLYRLIVDDYEDEGPDCSYLWDAPPIGTTHLRIRIVAKDAGDALLGEDTNDHEQVLFNNRGVAIDYRPPELDGRSEPRAVLRWNDPVEGAQRYQITIRQEALNSCETGWTPPVPYNVTWNPQLNNPPNYFEIPSPDWEQMGPSRWLAEVQAFDLAGLPLGPMLTVPFLKCRLEDEFPDDPDGATPVLLVHGWTSSGDAWFKDGSSPFIEAIRDESLPVEKRRHPWILEYPNVGGIRYSGAALGEAVAYLRHLGGHEKIQLVGHSMGGLVARTYLQSQAVKPSSTSLEEPEAYESFRDDVSRLVTFATPHLGAGGVGTAALVKWADGMGPCPGVGGGSAVSQSVRDLEATSALIDALANAPLPDDVLYFFAAGTDTRGEGWLGQPRQDILEGLVNLCEYGNDATVDVCSARGGGSCTGYHPHKYLDTGTATVVRRNYRLSHNRMALPGFDWTEEDRDEAADRLLADSQLALRLASTDFAAMADDPCEEPEQWVLKVWLSELNPFDKRRDGASAAPLVGAQVVIRPSEDSALGDGLVLTSDASGQARYELPGGSYIVEVAATGCEGRTESLTIPDGVGNLQWSLDLVLDPAYDGPRGPNLVINGGALTTPDSLLTLSLSCSNASEYKVSRYDDLADADWQAMAPEVAWSCGPDKGPVLVFARFRDGAGRESATVSDGITVRSDDFGSLSVTSSPPGAAIIFDSHATGRVTPAVFDCLVPGYHRVSLSVPGNAIMPVVATAEVDTGGTAEVDFDLAASLPPTPVDLGSLGDTDYLSGTPFEWSPAGDPEQQPVFYDVTIATDPDMSGVVWQRLGVPTSAVSAALADSHAYHIAITARDGHGVAQAEPAGPRRFHLDSTPPTVRVVSPAAGATLPAAAPAGLLLDGQDWGGLRSLVAILSTDGGSSFSDTVYAGAWSDSVTWTTPAAGREDDCLLQVTVADSAGNLVQAISDSTFTIFDGVTAVEREEPAQFYFSQPRHNPSRGPVHLLYGLPQSGRVRLSVFDLRGRLVRTLVDSALPPGRYETAWDGRDGGGRRLAAGVYCLRLHAGAYQETHKIVLIR